MDKDTSNQLTNDQTIGDTKAPAQPKPAALAPVAPKDQHRPSKWISLTIFGIFMVLLASFGGGWLAATLQSDGRSATSIDSLIQDDGTTVVTTDEELIAKVAKEVSPSVVSIVTSGSGQYGAYSQLQSAGTGIVLSKDGYIMTNNHVIDGAKNVSVILSNGTEYSKVRLIGKDPLNDVAFLKIENVSGLTPAKLGDSGKVRIGQQVVAIGNALGQFQTTVTSGIISAKGRPLTASSMDGSAQEQLTDLLQTDAAINSGNSGGPLVDLSGRVIGMNTAIAADANGIGFAIPVNATVGMIKGLLENGRPERAMLGVRYMDITPELAASQDLKVQHGAYISSGGADGSIQRGGPADKAGIKSRDIITKVNDVEVGKSGSLGSIVGVYRPGETVKLTIVRDGKSITKDVTLGAYRS